MLKRRACSRKDALLALKIVLKVNSSCTQTNKRKTQCKIKKNCSIKRRRRKRIFPVFPYPLQRCRSQQLIPRPCRTPHGMNPVNPHSPPCSFKPIDPVTPVDPIDPPDPVKPPSNIIVEKECCGNLLIQGVQPGFQIWQSDVESNLIVAQITIYCSPASTEAIEVEALGDERKHMYIPPGNTTNFVGQGIKLIKVLTQGNKHTYVEGKYNISTTIHLQPNPAVINEQ